MTRAVWYPIEQAPKNRPVWILNAAHPAWGAHLMMWNSTNSRWEGKNFGMMRSNTTYWDDKMEQPTHYRELDFKEIKDVQPETLIPEFLEDTDRRFESDLAPQQERNSLMLNRDPSNFVFATGDKDSLTLTNKIRRFSACLDKETKL